MPPEVLVLFFGTLFGLGGIILVGQNMRYRYLERARRAGRAPEEMERMGEALTAVREEVRSLRDELARLDERVTFTERLLERPKSGESGAEGMAR